MLVDRGKKLAVDWLRTLFYILLVRFFGQNVLGQSSSNYKLLTN